MLLNLFSFVAITTYRCLNAFAIKHYVWMRNFSISTIYLASLEISEGFIGDRNF